MKDIWLDCCGHLSAFSHKHFKVAMSHHVEDVFNPRIKIYHDYDYLYFCEKCTEKHEEECDGFVDYARMPVVNSPRMGVCGYEGGSIDTERDGPYRSVN